VAVGGVVARGQRLGTVGTGNGAWLAHLHFEIYEGACVDPGSGYSLRKGNRIRPAKLIETSRPTGPEGTAIAPLSVFESVQRVFQLAE
jgi:murein DD-endopeptidase MepM/ murein hydrolase activator NlpD